MKIEVTPKQNEYLQKLDEGPKTSKEFGVTMGAAAKTLSKLKAAELVKSERMKGKTIFEYRLVKPYQKLVEDGLRIVSRGEGKKVPEGEVFYAAILRNAGMTGRGLKDQYHKVYPDRTKSGVTHIVGKARKRRLCR